MPYVGDDFSYDLFVSYSHGSADSPGQPPSLQPWSLEFAAELHKELAFDKRFRDLEMFMDQQPRLGGGVDFMARLGKDLHDAVSASAILLVLLSQDYLDSEYCKQELEWWWSRQGNLAGDEDDRIAVVQIAPTDFGSWPEQLRDRVGYVFYDPAIRRPLGYVDFPPGPFGREFRMALVDLAGKLATKLDAIRGKEQERKRAKDTSDRLAMAVGQSLYLHCRAEHRNDWERAAKDLAADGFIVAGEPDEPHDDAQELKEARERRVATMKECDALLLLATDDKGAVDQDLIVVGKSDRELASAERRRALPCALLDRSGSVTTPIRLANARNLLIDWLDATMSPWTGIVRKWLHEKSDVERVAT